MPKSRSMNFVLRSVQMMHSENSIERQLSENYLGSRHLNQKQNCCVVVVVVDGARHR